VNTQRDPLAGRIPVTLITGFLGSGKTTLISSLVKHPDMNRVAVIINEIGEIGIDHDLVTMSSENISLLANGCICCSVRTDMQETLRELFAQRRAGLMIDFDRVIIETTGLADPAPVIQTLISDTLLAAQFRLDGVVTLVDAVNGPHLIEAQAEAIKQIALADRLFITKSDLIDQPATLALEESLRSLNPQAPMSPLINGVIEPSALLNIGLASAKAGPATLSFLGESLPPDSETSSEDAAEPSREKYLGEKRPIHDPAIKTLSLRFVKPFTWTSFSSALDLLSSLRGPDLLRMKGIVNVDGKPVVVQGVQHIFHPPVALDRWPSANLETRLIFITRNLSADSIRQLFEAVGAVTLASTS
jgi:G3E family GTPase